MTIAFSVAAPVAWLVMNQWLTEFAYRITIAWWMIAGGGLVGMTVALISIGFQTAKAATANPVDALRRE